MRNMKDYQPANRWTGADLAAWEAEMGLDTYKAPPVLGIGRTAYFQALKSTKPLKLQLQYSCYWLLHIREALAQAGEQNHKEWAAGYQAAKAVKPASVPDGMHSGLWEVGYVDGKSAAQEAHWERKLNRVE